MTLLHNIETILKTNHLNYLAVIQKRYGLDIKLYRAVDNVFNKVYGRDSGEENYTVHDTIQAIVIGDDFFPLDLSSGGTFKEGWLFTTSDKVLVGDRVEFLRDDCLSRRYHVETILNIGSSKMVFRKIRISALGD